MSHMEAAALPAENENSTTVDIDLSNYKANIAHAMVDSNYIVELDPATICESSLPNRDESSYRDDSFVDLQDTLVKERVNRTPIEIRPLEAVRSDGVRFEVVSGHRRWRASLNRGLMVRATIVHLDDKQVLRRRVAENTGRSDFSPHELGLICAKMMKAGGYVNTRQLALEITRDEGLVAKAMTIARWPEAIIEAFEEPGQIQYRYAKPLNDALEARYELVMTRARDIKARGGTRSPADVLSILIDDAKTPPAVAPDTEDAPAEKTLEPFKQAAGPREFKVDGKAVGKLTVDKKGQVRALIKMPLEPDVVATLHVAMLKVLASNAKRVAKAKANAVGEVAP